MLRFFPLLLLLLLQPRAAAAEELAYGYLATVAASSAAREPEAPRQLLLPADGVDTGASVGRPGDRPDRVPPETALRPGPGLRAPRLPNLSRASAPSHAAPCSPHCERLPYDATAPPLS